jgi:hypothetical protein
MARWERAVREAAALDGDLAFELAELASVVRGYGEVRRRLSRAIARFLDETLPPVVAEERAAGAGHARSMALVREQRLALLTEEEPGLP